ncbi:MAG TPA: redoxin domain-containing protein [Thermoanaerobaculia bacterium]|nr:redoxin domain-containing protein [Thermoanaerobaculia bacterium]
MPGPVSIGDVAPNFDLSSTEDALLMLRDEVIRMAVLVYFCADLESERVRRDLDALNRHAAALKKLDTRVLVVSPAKLDDLKKVQVERKLLFPLLHDDRNFSAAYGVAAAEEGKPADPALVLVGRRQQVKWLANPVASAEDALPQVEALLKGLPSPTKSYPKSVINRWVDRWVN